MFMAEQYMTRQRLRTALRKGTSALKIRELKSIFFEPFPRRGKFEGAPPISFKKCGAVVLSLNCPLIHCSGCPRKFQPSVPPVVLDAQKIFIPVLSRNLLFSRQFFSIVEDYLVKNLWNYYSANILRVNRFVDFPYEKPGKISRRCYWLNNRKH